MADTYQGQPKLNVVFHGLWAYEISKDGITVYTTKQADHVQRAGGWNPEFNLVEGEVYELRGVKKTGNGRFKKELNAIFQNKHLENEKDLYCTVKLPLPDDIQSLRQITFAKPPYTGADADEAKDTTKISIVQVLVYEPEKDLASISLVGTKDTLQLTPPAEGNIANLYFFAQPNTRVPPGHFEEAFVKLAGLFGLKIVPVDSLPPGPSAPGVPGLTWKDLVGLNERASLGEGLFPAGGVSGSNCDPFIVDNLSRASSTTTHQSSTPHPTTALE